MRSFFSKFLGISFGRKVINRLNLVYPYYMNGEMFIEHQKRWLDFPPDILNKLHFIIVDDGSPHKPAIDFFLDNRRHLNIDIYRIDIDKPWNNNGARNLGALFCINEWIFLSDMDHFLPLESVKAILTLQANRFEYFMFKRLDAKESWKNIFELKPYKPHMSTFLIHWHSYWEAGGYNEEYCGQYGMSWLFRRRLKRIGRERKLNAHVVRYTRNIVSDAHTATLTRKCDVEIKQIKKNYKKNKKLWQSSPLNPLRFPWHIEYSSRKQIV